MSYNIALHILSARVDYRNLEIPVTIIGGKRAARSAQMTEGDEGHVCTSHSEHNGCRKTAVARKS
jgi:hypothetical protein